MASKLTILKCKRRLKLTKTFNKIGDQYHLLSGYSKAAEFQLIQRDIGSIQSLAHLLVKLQRRPRYCVINAIPSNGAFDGGAWAPRKLNGTLKEIPIQAIFLDIDTMDIGLDIQEDTNLATVGKRVKRTLPHPFNKAECIVMATPSYGLKKGVHVRIIFYNSTPLKLDRLRHLFSTIKGIDLATLNANQLIYTAAPEFEEDGEEILDPVEKRLIVIKGETLKVNNADLPSKAEAKERITQSEALDKLLDAVKDAGLYVGASPNGQHDIECWQADRHSDPTDTSGAWISQEGDSIWCGCKHSGCGNGSRNWLPELCELLDIDLDLMSAERFLGRFAILREDNKIADLERRAVWAPTAFSYAYKTPFPTAFSAWSDSPHKRVLQGTAFEPNGNTILNLNGLEYMNLYRDPEQWLQGAGSADDWEAFLELTEFLWGENTDTVLDWCAHRVQYPERRPFFALYHIAPVQGLGRTTFIRILGRVLGKTYCKSTTVNALLNSQFNAALSQSVLVTVNETKDTNIKGGRYVLDHRLRDVLTDTELEVNHKYGQMGMESIYAGVIFLANELDSVGLPQEDRRLFVHRSIESFREPEFYDRMNALDTNGPAAVIRWHLKKRDLSEFMTIKRAPDTVYKQEIIESSGGELDQLMRDIREFWPYDLVTPQQLERIVVKTAPEIFLDAGLWRSICRGMFTKGGKNKNEKLYFHQKMVLPWVLRREKEWRGKENKAWIQELDSSEVLLIYYENVTNSVLEDLWLI